MIDLRVLKQQEGDDDLIRKLCAFLLSLFLMIPLLASAELKIHFIDVGQGDSVLVQCGESNLLVDAGPAEAGETVNHYLLTRLGIREIDSVIATHEHDDHIGGMQAALKDLSVGHVYSSPAISGSYWFQTILPVLNQNGLEISFPAFQDSFRLGDATVTFCNPLSQAENANDRCLVVRIDYEDTSVLLTADIESEAEAAMLQQDLRLKADILKVAHHGGNTSNTEAFIRAVSPSIAVISVGKGNKHGHPHAEPLRTLEKYGIAIYRTDQFGNIICTSDGKSWIVEVSKAR